MTGFVFKFPVFVSHTPLSFTENTVPVHLRKLPVPFHLYSPYREFILSPFILHYFVYAYHEIYH